MNSWAQRELKQTNEIWKTMQDMKEEINKDIEIWKNNQFEMNSAISQIKTSIESLAKRVKQVENRVSGTEDKVQELNQSVKDHEKCQENMNGTCKTSRTL
jgi:predicted  nucleic acid-binding Zn-ribbon protein